MSYTPPGSPPPPPGGYGYGQPGYPNPGYPNPGYPPARQSNGLAVAALVTGLLSVFVVFLAQESNSDPSDGVCNSSRTFQDPDCGVGIDSDPVDGTCDPDRRYEDPDC